MVVGAYLSLALKRETEYKGSFYVFVVNNALTFVMWLLFWKIILGAIGGFGAWDFPMMVLLTGFAGISAGMWVLFIAVWRLPGAILTGNFNNYLIRPKHPLLFFIGRGLNIRSLTRVFIGLGLLVYALIVYDFNFSVLQLLIALVIAFIGFLTTYLPFVILSLLTFWIGKAEFIRDLYTELFIFQHYPLSEFSTPVVGFFTLVVPYVFVGTVPVFVLVRWTLWQSLGVLLFLFVLIAVQIFVFNIVWKKGLRRYESYGG